MARIRTVKPEYWQDEKLAPLPAIDRLVFLGLISQADDAGRLVDSVRLLDGLLFPLTDDTCGPSLESLASVGVIERGITASGQRVIQLCGWAKHQRVDHPTIKSVLPPVFASGSRADRENIASDSLETRDSTYDLLTEGPTTNDQRPTTNDQHSPPPSSPNPAHAREKAAADDGGRAAAVAEMQTDLAVELERVLPGQRARLQAAGRSLLAGESRTAWLDPRTKGADVVPWGMRPTLFRLALSDCMSEGKITQRALAGKLKLHILRELDPLPQKPRPVPGSEQARIYSRPERQAEYPQQSGVRNGKLERLEPLPPIPPPDDAAARAVVERLKARGVVKEEP